MNGRVLRWIVLLVVVVSGSLFAQQGFVVDHTCLDIDAIPDSVIDTARAWLGIYFAHKSHGRQIVEGLGPLAQFDARYVTDVSYTTSSLSPDVLSIRDDSKFVADFLSSAPGVLEEHTWVNVCMFVWCTELNWGTYPDETPWDSVRVQGYLDSMMVLEERFPRVHFVYSTGTAYNVTAQTSYNRMLLNRMIRRHCVRNNRILYDFADLDAWAYEPDSGRMVQATITYDADDGEVVVPIMHSSYGNDAMDTHINAAGQEVKAKAFWWLMARLAAADGVRVGNTAFPMRVYVAGHRTRGAAWTLQGRVMHELIVPGSKTAPRPGGANMVYVRESDGGFHPTVMRVVRAR